MAAIPTAATSMRRVPGRVLPARVSPAPAAPATENKSPTVSVPTATRNTGFEKALGSPGPPTVLWREAASNTQTGIVKTPLSTPNAAPAPPTSAATRIWTVLATPVSFNRRPPKCDTPPRSTS